VKFFRGASTTSIGFGEKSLGNALRGALAGDALNSRLLFLDVLQIDGGSSKIRRFS
jgi:hypothetical protein